MESLKEFINRSTVLLKDICDLDESRHEHNKRQKKYFNTTKGCFAKSKGDYKRRALIKESIEKLTKEEKKLIGEFYKNCPEDYEVDHIIPVSRGGLHKLSNLQYLEWEKNRKKWAKID